MESVSNILSRYSDNSEKVKEIKRSIIDDISDKLVMLDLEEPAEIEVNDDEVVIRIVYPGTYELLSDLNRFVESIGVDPEHVLMDFRYCMLVLMVDLEKYFCGGTVSL